MASTWTSPYAVYPALRGAPQPDAPGGQRRRERRYFRAEVHLREGDRTTTSSGWTRDEVIGDILDQYERHRHYLHVVH